MEQLPFQSWVPKFLQTQTPIQYSGENPPLRCPLKYDPEGRPALDDSCWQCRLRNFIDNKIFLLIYIFLLIILSQYTSFLTILIYVFIMTIVTVAAHMCSFSGNLPIKAAENLLITSFVTLVASYFVFAIVRLIPS